MTAGAFGQGRHRQCGAMSKRTKVQCRAPAMNGKRVCYHHGGRSPGAKANEKHWNFKSGDHSLEARELARIARVSRKRMRKIGAIDANGEYVPPNERPPEPPMSQTEMAAVLKTEMANMRSAVQIEGRIRGKRSKRPSP